MSKKEPIPVHRMDDWFSGVYIKPFGAEKSSGNAYDSSQAHRHDFYYCVLMDKGKMEMEIDFEKVQLADQTLFLSYPGQIHQVSSARIDRGWYLAFDPSILDDKLKDILDQCLSEVILVPLSLEQSASLSSFINLLYEAYVDHTQPFSQTITQLMMTAFVYQLVSVYLSMERFNLVRHSSFSITLASNKFPAKYP